MNKKIILLLFIFAGTLFFATISSAQMMIGADGFTYSGVMRTGMSGLNISTLQTALNKVNVVANMIAVDGKFGPATQKAVEMFQMAHGLMTDGVVGPITGEALKNAILLMMAPGNVPAGCTSTSGFSATTGMPCSAMANFPAGCTSMIGFSPTTGMKCDGGAAESGWGNNDSSADDDSNTDSNTSDITGSGPHFVSTSASLISVDGADNDLGEYVIKVRVNAFGDDAFISQSGEVAYAAQIEDASTGDVLTPTSISTVISSNADTENGSYRINEDSSENFTFTITANPAPTDEGKSIRAQLLRIDSGSAASDPTGNTFIIGADNLSKYQTTGIVIPD